MIAVIISSVILVSFVAKVWAVKDEIHAIHG